MTDLTRKQIVDAHDALESLTDTCVHDSELAEELRELVLRALPPRPQTTMADLEWDDDAHYLAEAEHADWGKGIMISCECYGTIRCVIEGEIYLAKCEDLTPTGKRYTLTEVQDD